MIRQYYRRVQKANGRLDRNGSCIADRIIYKGVVLAYRKPEDPGTIRLGFALVNPAEPGYPNHSKDKLNWIAERRMMSDRYTIPINPTESDVYRFLSGIDRPYRDGNPYGERKPIPQQLENTIRRVIERASRMNIRPVNNKETSQTAGICTKPSNLA